MTASIGIATFPEDGLTSEILIRNADTAMYHAKQQGKAAFQYYSAAMNAASVERLTLESGPAARARGRQPRAALPAAGRRAHRPHRRRRGAAALAAPAARLHLAGNVHPDRRGLGPDPADRRMGARAARAAQAAEWQRAGLPTMPIAVNVSGVQFQPPGPLRARARARSRRRASTPSMLRHRDHRDGDRVGARARDRAARVSCASSASASRSTTSAPATRR